VFGSALLSTGAAAWLLVFVEESRCRVDNLAWVTVLALLLTLVPTGVAVRGRAPWWLGAVSTGVALLLLLTIFRPGGVYDCYYRISG
jgi:hypothetical protein